MSHKLTVARKTRGLGASGRKRVEESLYTFGRIVSQGKGRKIRICGQGWVSMIKDIAGVKERTFRWDRK